MKSGDLVQHRSQVCTWRCAHASTIGGLISSQEQAAALPGLIRLIIILSDVLMISTAGMFVLLSNIVVVSDHNLQFTWPLSFWFAASRATVGPRRAVGWAVGCHPQVILHAQCSDTLWCAVSHVTLSHITLSHCHAGILGVTFADRKSTIIDPLPQGKLHLNNEKTFNSGLWWQVPSPEERRRSCWLRCSGEMKRAAPWPGAAAHLTTQHLATFLHPLLILIPSSWHFPASAQNVKCPPDTSHGAETNPNQRRSPEPRPWPWPRHARERWPFFAGVLAGLGWAGRCVQSECGTKSVAITMSQLQPSPASCPRPRAARSTTGIFTQPAQPSPAQPSSPAQPVSNIKETLGPAISSQAAQCSQPPARERPDPGSSPTAGLGHRNQRNYGDRATRAVTPHWL